MIKSLLLLSTFALFLGLSKDVSIDPAASEIVWKGYKVTGSHHGTISLKEGSLEFQDSMLVGGSFVMDMPSIKVVDLTGGGATRLEGHLKSDDFFGVETHPTATFVITKVVSRGTPGDYRITGDMTIKEKTESLRFNAKVVEEMGVYKATAELKIDRSDFDVRYGSGSFIDNLGDKTIYDEFDLGITLVTEK